MLKRILPNSWWCRCLWIAATYIIAADLIPNVLLIIVNSVGYLPYSDRPGPGWQMPHLPSGAEMQFFGGFVLLLLPATALYGVSFAAAGLALGFCLLPRWALRVLATPTAFIASGLMMAAGGWMIAISSVGVYIAAGCGALWGLLVFPGLVPLMDLGLPIAIRRVLSILVIAAGTYALIKPLLPDPGLTNAKIEIIRRDDSGADLSGVDLSYIGPSIVREVKGSGKYVSVSRMEFKTDDRNQVRILLIVDDAHPISNTFLLPRSGDVVYRQSHEKWSKERGEARDSRLSLQLSALDSARITLHLNGPCCSSMTQTFAPYR